MPAAVVCAVGAPVVGVGVVAAAADEVKVNRLADRCAVVAQFEVTPKFGGIRTASFESLPVPADVLPIGPKTFAD